MLFCLVYTEIHTVLLYSALIVELSEWHGKSISYLNENSWTIMLSRALCERGSCTDLSLYRQAEWINSLQRFWNWQKQTFFSNHTLISRTLCEPSSDTDIACRIFVSVCVSGAACKFVCILYNSICMYTLVVDVVWMSNPAKLEPESLSCWMCFLSLPGLSSLGVKKELLCKGNWVLADRSVKYNQRCQSWKEMACLQSASPHSVCCHYRKYSVRLSQY